MILLPVCETRIKIHESTNLAYNGIKDDVVLIGLDKYPQIGE